MKTEESFIEDIRPTGFVVLVAIGVGLLFVALQQFPQSDAIQQGLRALFAAVLWSLACLIAGGFVGFLFGIPRILQSDTAAAPRPVSQPGESGTAFETPVASNYRPNTNLDQISDWLTKIIVGLGLVNLQKVPERLSQAAEFIAWSLTTVIWGPRSVKPGQP